MRLRSWLVAGGIAAIVATASGATADGGARSGSSGGGCGQEQELVAAKRALQRGDREGALRHLKRADALLQGCIRNGGSAPAADEDQVAETQTG